MFKEIFSLRFGLACETQILEACGWDEERSKEVVDIFSEFISSCADSGLIEKDKIAKKLHDDFSDALSEDESSVLMEILEESIANSTFLLNKDDYEN